MSVFVFNDTATTEIYTVLTHSFPTRRSSDLPLWRRRPRGTRSSLPRRALKSRSLRSASPSPSSRRAKSPPGRASQSLIRSEEHTSELQSLMRISYDVFCLKKKKQTTLTHNNKNKLTIKQLYTSISNTH